MRPKKLRNNKAVLNRKSDSFTRRYSATKLYHKHRIILEIQFPRALSLPARGGREGGGLHSGGADSILHIALFYIFRSFMYCAILGARARVPSTK